jgi:hypothetical protein
VSRNRKIQTIIISLILVASIYIAARSVFSVPKTPVRPSNITWNLDVDDQSAGKLPTYRVKVGDQVTLVAKPNKPGELHIHGFEKKVSLEPGHAIQVTLNCASPGLFVIHRHGPDGSSQRIGALDVRPL